MPFRLDIGKGERNMKQTCTAVIKQHADWWIGSIEEVPGVDCQESSRETLSQSLRDTLIEAIDLNRADALAATEKRCEELPIAL